MPGRWKSTSCHRPPRRTSRSATSNPRSSARGTCRATIPNTSTTGRDGRRSPPGRTKPSSVPPRLSPARPPQIKLFNSHEFTPEMELLTSPKGSLLQPAPSFRFTELNDECQYTAWLSFIDADGAKCHAQYQHPDAPRPGELWNGKVVSFDRLKLYRDDGSDHPPVSLKTGKIYRIQVNVGCVDEHGHVQSATVTRQLIGTTFIAVDKKTSAEPGKRSK
ncbi:hypothetical protein MRX96_020222 [Rhipicephalus microplus]